MHADIHKNYLHCHILTDIVVHFRYDIEQKMNDAHHQKPEYLSKQVQSPYASFHLEEPQKVLLSKHQVPLLYFLFLGYLFLVSRLEDIQRTFMYHGAEHKTIACLEHGEDLTVENVMKHSRFHKRCGTSFLFLVMIISILFFMWIHTDTMWLRLLLRLALVPVIAGVSYEFISLAEKDGSIIQIGEIVLEECCRFLSKHILANESLGIRTIQVNVSVAQCMQQSMKDKIMPVLKKYHIPPSMITLEITESTEIQATDLMLRQMEELNELGIQFAADDYGTGNSNFSYLVKFPFREIKIDKTMTWAYFENETARIILENEIRTMEKLGISVVVEGIETKEQSDAMEAIGIKYIQGYYYGKPMPEKDCLFFLRSSAQREEDYGR